MPLLWSKFTSKAFLKTNNELKKTSSMEYPKDPMQVLNPKLFS